MSAIGVPSLSMFARRRIVKILSLTERPFDKIVRESAFNCFLMFGFSIIIKGVAMPNNFSWKDLEKVRLRINSIPYYKTLSMQLENVDDNGSSLRIKLGDKHKNLWGSVHGGVVASLVDAACGLSVIPFLKDGETMVTAVMQVQYFAPAHIGSGNLIGRGKVVNRGRHLISAEGEIFNEEEKLVAKGVSVLKILRNRTLE